jgi:two-component system sensor histidine kinase UhpB
MKSASPAFPLRVLVVEDYEADYELLLAHLERNGFAPTSQRVQSAREMQAALEAEGWDVVISDYNVPGFGALPALKLLQASGYDIPFILMSGAIGEEAAVEAMRTGAEDYVPKDRPARLVPAIRRGLEARILRREKHRAEAALRAVADNLPGMLFRMNTDSAGMEPRFDYASIGGKVLFGVSPEQLLEDPAVLFNIFEGEERARFFAQLYAAARGGTTLRGEFKVRPPSGGMRWVQVAATQRAASRALVWDGLFSDITPLKEVEARLLLSQAQLRELTAHLQSAKEAERAEIAREIHDDIGGSLTAMKADLASLARRVDDPAGRERLESLGRLVDGAMRVSQAVARSLRPASLDQGLYTALRWQARDFTARHGIPVKLSANDEDVDLDLDASTALFRIFQEGLTNIAKHAGAQTVEATLFSNGSMVSLEIRDDGKGVDPSSLDKAGSFGVFGMNERVRNLGGWLEIDGSPGGGTTLMVSLPRPRRGVGKHS